MTSPFWVWALACTLVGYTYLLIATQALNLMDQIDDIIIPCLCFQFRVGYCEEIPVKKIVSEHRATTNTLQMFLLWLYVSWVVENGARENNPSIRFCCNVWWTIYQLPTLEKVCTCVIRAELASAQSGDAHGNASSVGRWDHQRSTLNAFPCGRPSSQCFPMCIPLVENQALATGNSVAEDRKFDCW